MNKIFILFYKYRAVWEVSFQNFSFCNFHIYHLEKLRYAVEIELLHLILRYFSDLMCS